MRTSLQTLVALPIFLLVAAAPAVGVPGDLSPLEPASTGGLGALDRALVRLASHQRLLVIAAHPDDEDTALLTWVARGLGGEAAYLSLSRGDGGQNLIGPELGVGLGLLRSRELQSARRIDGARQFFSRAYDFGYTRSLEETLERWPKEVLLEDAMRVVRRFKPQVLVTIFSPTAAAGHGQHQASGLIAEEIFKLSADEDAFSQRESKAIRARLDAEGLAPWKVSSFYRTARRDPDAATHELPLGTIEPFTGRSILQLALASRSQHRCQDMGSLQPLGDASGRLIWVAGAGGPGTDAGGAPPPFAGIDTRLAAIADLLPAGDLRRETALRLTRVAEIAGDARRQLGADEPRQAVEPLLEILRLLRAVEQDLEGTDSQASQSSRLAGAISHVHGLVAEKLWIAGEALANAAQIAADAVTAQETVVPGERFEVRSMFWNAGGLPVTDLEVTAVSPAGWCATGSRPAESQRSRFAARLSDERILEIEVPPASGPTTPYFLRRPRRGDLYDWSETAPEVRGEPFEPPPLSLRFAFNLAGEPIELEREVVQRVRDQALGEVRRPLQVVPELEVSVEPELVVWPLGEHTETLEVTIAWNAGTSNGERVRARLEIEVPPGWRAIEPTVVELEPSRRSRVVEVELKSSDGVTPGRHAVRVAAVTTGEPPVRFDQGIRRIDYPHVRPVAMSRPATVEISAGDIALPALRRLGFIRGASDRMPRSLIRIGLPLEVFSAQDLATEDLATFDAIVVGSRAYEVDPALLRTSSQLLDYARAGGLLIVQYQQYQFTRGGYAPFPLEIRRPHDRVTDETAPVTLLEPEHPVFTTPNRLGDADWQGWVQERGLYMAGTWDDTYRPLLAMADPGGEEKRGALLVARLGKGHYVYTGLALFRQLPAGVTGAYRLFANLLALANHGEDAPGEST